MPPGSKRNSIKNAVPPDMSVLDLPDLVLECILEKLQAEGLRRMASVCSSLRESWFSDHLWQNHMMNKWGRVIGAAADDQWQKCCVALRKAADQRQSKHKGLMNYFTRDVGSIPSFFY